MKFALFGFLKCNELEQTVHFRKLHL